MTSPVVAVINTNPDVVEMLKAEIERAGFIVTTVHIAEIRAATVDIAAFLEQHDPKVIVYDVPPPYDRHWRFMEHLRRSPAFRGRHFVLTTVNVERLQQLVKTEESVYEVVGRSDDLGAIVTAVKEASRARPTRD